MKLTKEAKDLIDKWFDNKTPEEVDYIISKYTPNKQLPIHGVIERLPIGTEVTIIDHEDWGEQRGTKKTITGYTDFGKKQGYLLDGVGIYLIEDFEANVLELLCL